ncbi:MAG: Ig-like domain repeat protein [Thermococcus sp.]|uniref:hypothetical protein n=1 Tax=Thermococcus sp. TaxID=35749 RepID=UPI001DF6B29A|nr:hypothetical protein [Thermococcus sp.]MBO8175030.1 Ig-like domain repeat protein [Thermococcus sp.]
MKRMLTVGILLMLAVSSIGVSGEGRNYSTVNPNDYGVYLYFNSLLKDFNSILEGIISESNDTTNAAFLFYSQINITKDEIPLYSSYNISSKAYELIPYFDSLGRCSLNLAIGQRMFLDGLSNREYPNARKGLFSMKIGLEECRSSVDALSNVVLSAENTTVKFETKDIVENLNKIETIIKMYQRILDKYFKPKEFVLFVSDLSPAVYTNVTFYGYTGGLEDVSIVINNTAYPAEVVNGNFYFTYSFKKIGTYEVYAVGKRGNNIEISNKIVLNVSKMPTKLLISQKNLLEVIVEGYLIDKLGRGIGGKEIIIHSANDTLMVTTKHDGSFMVSFGQLLKEKNVTISFLGNEIYRGCNVTVTLKPSKVPIDILLIAEKQKVRVGQKVLIKGLINGTTERIPLIVYIDNKPYTTINTQQNFSIVLHLEKGKHEIYAKFPGNEKFAESVSNIITIEVVPINYLVRFLIIIVSVLLAFGAYRLISASKEKKELPAGVQKVFKAIEEEKAEEMNILRAYRVVYNLLRKLYALPKSTTPRELLNKLRKEPFFEDITKLTLLHEKYLYARKKLSIREITLAFRLAARVIISSLVREEL